MNQAKMAQKQAELAKKATEDPTYRFINLYSLMHWDYWITQAANTVLKRPGSETAGVDDQTKDAFKTCFNEEISSLTHDLRQKSLTLSSGSDSCSVGKFSDISSGI
jgi:hypothetical protein